MRHLRTNAPILRAEISAESTTQEIVAAKEGHQIVVLSVRMRLTAEATVQWQSDPGSEANTDLTGPEVVPATGIFGAVAEDYGIFATEAGSSLVLAVSAGAAYGCLTYIQIPPNP